MPYRIPKLLTPEDINKETPQGVVTRLLERKKHPGTTTNAQRRRALNKARGHKQKGQWFSDEEKMEAVAVYVATGNASRVEELTKVPAGTVRNWKTQDWWHELVAKIHQEKDEELDSKFNKIIDKSLDLVLNRLEDGEYIYDTKRGEIVRVPVKAKDASIITAITVDKRELLRGKPTSRQERIGTDQRLLKLAEEFKKFSSSRDITSLVEVTKEISVENKSEEIVEEIPVEFSDKEERR